jgi:hypothetical protein
MQSRFISTLTSTVMRPIWVAALALSMIWVLTPARAAPAELLSVNGTTGTVNPADPCPDPRNSAVYKTIAKAIACALAGDTITVAAGTYNENVMVNKAVTLLGANAGVDARNLRGVESIINGGGVSAPIGMSASGAIVDGFRLQAGQNSLGAGVWMGGSVTGVQLLNNVITDNTIGLAIIGGCPCLVRHNWFNANNRSGPAGYKALYAENTNGLLFEENNVTGHTVDVPIVFANTNPPNPTHFNVTFTGNAIFNNTINGAYLLGVSASTFRANNFVGRGLWFAGGNSNITVTTNNFTNGAPAIQIFLRTDGTGNNYGPNSNIKINFNRFIANSPYAIVLTSNYVGTLNAEDNWWGCNYGPGATGSGCTAATNSNNGAAIDAVPWIILKLASAQPTVGQNGGTVSVTAYLTGTSAGTDVSSLGYVPDAIPVNLSSTGGTLTPTIARTTGGKASSTFMAGPALGTALITATVDSQTVNRSLLIVPNIRYLPAILRP